MISLIKQSISSKHLMLLGIFYGGLHSTGLEGQSELPLSSFDSEDTVPINVLSGRAICSFVPARIAPEMTTTADFFATYPNGSLITCHNPIFKPLSALVSSSLDKNQILSHLVVNPGHLSAIIQKAIICSQNGPRFGIICKFGFVEIHLDDANWDIDIRQGNLLKMSESRLREIIMSPRFQFSYIRLLQEDDFCLGTIHCDIRPSMQTLIYTHNIQQLVRVFDKETLLQALEILEVSEPKAKSTEFQREFIEGNRLRVYVEQLRSIGLDLVSNWYGEATPWALKLLDLHNPKPLTCVAEVYEDPDFHNLLSMRLDVQCKPGIIRIYIRQVEADTANELTGNIKLSKIDEQIDKLFGKSSKRTNLYKCGVYRIYFLRSVSDNGPCVYRIAHERWDDDKMEFTIPVLQLFEAGEEQIDDATFNREFVVGDGVAEYNKSLDKYLDMHFAPCDQEGLYEEQTSDFWRGKLA